MTVYTLFDDNKFEVFANGGSFVVLFVDEHCHRIYCETVKNCGYDILKFFDYNGLVNLPNDFNALKEDFLRKAKSPNFDSVLDRKGLLTMNFSTYINGYLDLDIEEGEIQGNLTISFDHWSPNEIDNAFKEAEDYITRFKNQRLLLCEKLVAKIKEVCKQEGLPFIDPFEPKKKEKPEKKEKPKEEGKKEQETQGFFNWLINLFR